MTTSTTTITTPRTMANANATDPAEAARRLLEHIDTDPTAPGWADRYDRLRAPAPDVTGTQAPAYRPRGEA